MKFYYVIKEYIKVTFQCLAYIYKFNKLGTIYRFSLLLIFPIISNALSIANAHLADSLQKNFNTGLISILMPIFTIIVGLEILHEITQWFNRSASYQWRTNLRVLLEVERTKKKATLTIPYIDSEDNEQFFQRVSLSGDGFNAQLSLIATLPTLISILINVVFGVYIIARFNILFAVIIFISALPSFYISFIEIFAKRKNFERHLTYQRHTGVYGNQFANYVNLKDSKSSGSTDEMLEIYRERKDFIIKDQFVLFKKYLNLGLVTNIFTLAIGFFIQYFVIKDVVFGYLLIGQATLIVTQTFRLQGNIQGIAEFIPEQYENVVAAKYIFLYLKTTENVEQTKALPPENNTSDIEMTDISFSYPEVRFVAMRKLSEEIDTISEKYFGLKKLETDTDKDKKQNNFTLTIPHLKISKGERVAIVGKNGNGKTTFLQLVLNLYQPQAGTIEIFGNNIHQLNQKDVQKYYSVLFQDYGQTNFKVNEYIALSEISNPDIDRIKVAAKKATASDFIEKWNDTYTQQLGVSFKGVKPSKGQWQKLALARAFYKEAPIIVLDEPTSAIDAVSAKKIFQNLAETEQEKILLFVCHNMVDIPLAATRILVFDEGKIVGDGNHDTLMKNCEAYKELYNSEVVR